MPRFERMAIPSNPIHPSLARLVEGLPFSGNVRADMTAFLNRHGFPRTVEHQLNVADQAVHLAKEWSADPGIVQVAAWLHDVSVVFPNRERLAVARELEIPILPLEEQAPMLLHQKISAVMANQIFAVESQEILQAIGCHTTLRPGFNRSDLILFIADKLAWDQAGAPPFLEAIHAGLQASLESAACNYLEFLQTHPDMLVGPLHPWALGAYSALGRIVHGMTKRDDPLMTRVSG